MVRGEQAAMGEMQDLLAIGPAENLQPIAGQRLALDQVPDVEGEVANAGSAAALL